MGVELLSPTDGVSRSLILVPFNRSHMTNVHSNDVSYLVPFLRCVMQTSYCILGLLVKDSASDMKTSNIKSQTSKTK